MAATKHNQIILVILLGLFAILQYRIWFASDGIIRNKTYEQVLLERVAENDQLRIENSILFDDVKQLKSKEELLEEEARMSLGMIKSGETYYRVLN